MSDFFDLLILGYLEAKMQLDEIEIQALNLLFTQPKGSQFDLDDIIVVSRNDNVIGRYTGFKKSPFAQDVEPTSIGDSFFNDQTGRALHIMIELFDRRPASLEITSHDEAPLPETLSGYIISTQSAAGKIKGSA